MLLKVKVVYELHNTKLLSILKYDGILSLVPAPNHEIWLALIEERINGVPDTVVGAKFLAAHKYAAAVKFSISELHHHLSQMVEYIETKRPTRLPSTVALVSNHEADDEITKTLTTLTNDNSEIAMTWIREPEYAVTWYLDVTSAVAILNYINYIVNNNIAE